MARTQKHRPARRPRFKRRDPPPFMPTADDRQFVLHTLEHRFLRASHYVALSGRPADKVIRRLSVLYHNGYLDRPRAQRYLPVHGNHELIYAPGHKAPLLFGETPGLDWTAKNREAKHAYLEHALMIADFMVALEVALRRYPAVRILRSAEIIEDIRQRTGTAPNHWTMTVEHPDLGIQLSATPDTVFALEFSDLGRRNYFLLEADRSTMPIERAALDQSSYKKKLLTYHLGHTTKRHVNAWGIPGFRVLTITKSAQRISSMLAALSIVTKGKGSNAFLFAEIDALLASDPLITPLITGKNGSVQLVGS